VRFGLFLETKQQKEDASEKPRGKLGANIFQSTVVLITLSTVWIVVGSAVYPLWWFEFFFRRGFSRWDLTEYGFTYLLDNVSWLLFGLPILAVALALLAWKAWIRIPSFLDRFGAYFLATCLIACCLDAYVLNKTQRLQYDLYSGFLHISDTVAEATGGLLALALPPSRIVPPVDFLYIDTTRISSLYDQLQPAFIENERTVTTERKKGGSLDIERKPLELKAGGSKSTTEARHFKNVDASTVRECLDLINNLLVRESPPYYASFGQLGTFELVEQAKKLVNSVHRELAPQSLFVRNPVDLAAVATLKQMTAARKKTPPEVIENGIRGQLRQLSGLVIVQGEFRRTVRRSDASEFEETFKDNPRAIYFRFTLRDKDALTLLADHQNLLVLGDVIRKWDGGRYLEVNPIAILVSNP
jgi:hypothetical protein